MSFLRVFINIGINQERFLLQLQSSADCWGNKIAPERDKELAKKSLVTESMIEMKLLNK